MRTVAGLLVAVACVVVAGCGGGEDSGDLIVFSSDRDGDFEIFVMNADGTEVRQLTYNDKVDVSPSWSLDGERIAFTSDRDGDFEIFVMNADGTEVRQLTYNDNMDYRPTWFEDGKHFYFVSDRGDPGGEGEVFMMNADKFVEPTEPDEDSKETLRELAEKTGSTEEELEAAIKKSIEDLLGPNYGEPQLTDLAPSSLLGRWSPGRKLVAFADGRDGDQEIFVQNSDGTEVRQLTYNDDMDVRPAWSLDGKRIAFTSDRYGSHEIFVMNADGTNVYTTGQNGREPNWGD